MTPELLNKLKHLANIAAHLPADVTLEDEDAALKALHGELAADTVLELIALVERTTAPVSLTDEGIIAYAAEIFDFKPHKQGEEQKAKWITFARALLAAAPAPIQQDSEAPARQALHTMQYEDGRIGWYFDCDGHYIDVEKDDAGKYSVYFRDRATGKEGWLDQADSATPPALAGSQVQAAVDVLAERERQKQQEGWTPERDDKYIDCELARAAATYSLCTDPEQIKVCGAPVWPWPIYWWKPTTYRRNLVKAGALILAEIERLDRAAMREQP